MISVIICSIDDQKFARVTDSFAQAFGADSIHVIRVQDAKGLAEGYNRALPHATGELVIFCHDDIEILSSDFKEKLLGHMQRADLVGVAGARRVVSGKWANACPPHIFGQVASFDPQTNLFGVWLWGVPARHISNIKILDGVFMCAKREVAQAVPFDAQTFDGFHGYDVDFSFRAYQAGFRLAVGCDLLLLHWSTGNWNADWERYEQAFRQKHAGQLDVMPQRGMRTGIASCRTRQELVELMTPAWDSE
ncbi:MAG TPA: glycosyltransferase [Tepidisphaeraceae bacterium]|nr:glycosyltransferase [Tepidisphaeraceae bacterium]